MNQQKENAHANFVAGFRLNSELFGITIIQDRPWPEIIAEDRFSYMMGVAECILCLLGSKNHVTQFELWNMWMQIMNAVDSKAPRKSNI